MQKIQIKSWQKIEIKSGLSYYPEALNRTAQEALLKDIRAIIAQAPLYSPVMPYSGKTMSAQSTNCGTLGWYSDQRDGYRYQSLHPNTQKPWPTIPQSFSDIWHLMAQHPEPLDCGLINYYDQNAKMGLHVDQDEQDFTAPVISLSLGDQAQFVIGGLQRQDKTSSLKLHSGDIIIMSGAMRKVYHGIAKIYPHSSTLIKEGGRFNITLRKAG